MPSRATPVRLSELSRYDGKVGGGGGGGEAPRQYARSKPSQEQTDAIGLAGEALAYSWLQRHYPETTADSWVSANRTFLLGGHPGDDKRGYDFEIARKNETLFFEVKTTTTDEHAFASESQSSCARRSQGPLPHPVHRGCPAAGAPPAARAAKPVGGGIDRRLRADQPGDAAALRAAVTAVERCHGPQCPSPRERPGDKIAR